MRNQTVPTGQQEILEQIARRIDPPGSLFATQRAAAYFITQKYLYLNPPLPQSVDYLLLDLRDSRRATPNPDLPRFPHRGSCRAVFL
jgi:hypothetical protein